MSVADQSPDTGQREDTFRSESEASALGIEEDRWHRSWSGTDSTPGQNTERVTEDSAEGSMEEVGRGQCTDACRGELAEHHEHSMHSVDDFGESHPEGDGTVRPAHAAHAAHVESCGALCSHVNRMDVHGEQEEARWHACASPQSAAMSKDCRGTDLPHHACAYTARHANAAGNQRAVYVGEPMWGALLGCSGHVTAAAQESLKEIQEVHQSDGLMHFEGCWPHPVLTKV